jgi:hypothetical protein
MNVSAANSIEQIIFAPTSDRRLSGAGRLRAGAHLLNRGSWSAQKRARCPAASRARQSFSFFRRTAFRLFRLEYYQTTSIGIARHDNHADAFGVAPI